jgi:hypothetical protein
LFYLNQGECVYRVFPIIIPPKPSRACLHMVFLIIGGSDPIIKMLDPSYHLDILNYEDCSYN